MQRLAAVLISVLLAAPAFAQYTNRFAINPNSTRDIKVTHKAHNQANWLATITGVDLTDHEPITCGVKSAKGDNTFFALSTGTVVSATAGTVLFEFPTESWVTNNTAEVEMYGDIRLTDFDLPLPSLIVTLKPAYNWGSEVYVSPANHEYQTNAVSIGTKRVINFNSGFTASESGDTLTLSVTAGNAVDAVARAGVASNAVSITTLDSNKVDKAGNTGLTNDLEWDASASFDGGRIGQSGIFASFGGGTKSLFAVNDTAAGLAYTEDDGFVADDNGVFMAGYSLRFADSLLSGAPHTTVNSNGVWTYTKPISAPDAVAATDLATKQQVDARGDVFKVGTPVDNQVGVWTGDGTLEGQSDFVRLASGNVGIGTAAPVALLHINETDGTAEVGTVTRLSTDAGGALLVRVSDKSIGAPSWEFLTGTSEDLIFSPGGNVLIGTTVDAGAYLLQVAGDARVDGTVTATAFVGDGSGLTGISGGYRELISSSEFNPTASGAPDTVYTNSIPAIQPDDGNNETMVTEYRQVFAGETNYTVEAYWYADTIGDYVWSVMGNAHTTTITSTSIAAPTFDSWTFTEAVPAAGMQDISVTYSGADAGTTAGNVITTWFSLKVAP